MPPPALVIPSADVLQAPICTATIHPPVFKIYGFEKTEYKGDVLSAVHPTQTADPADPGRVESLCGMVCGGRWVNDFGAFSMGE